MINLWRKPKTDTKRFTARVLKYVGVVNVNIL